MGSSLARVLPTVAIALTLASTPAAHHSPSLFDLRTEVSLTGVIATFQFRSPHLYFHLEVTEGSDRDGECVVVVVNPPHERGKKLALGRSVRKSDGTTLRIPWEREEIRKALRDEEASKR